MFNNPSGNVGSGIAKPSKNEVKGFFGNQMKSHSSKQPRQGFNKKYPALFVETNSPDYMKHQ